MITEEELEKLIAIAENDTNLSCWIHLLLTLMQKDETIEKASYLGLCIAIFTK